MQQLADQKRKRGRYVWLIGVLLFLSLTLPHVHLDGQPYGRSLLLTGFYFLHAQSATFTDVDTALLAFGFNVTYLGIGLHELGLMLAATTFWVLYPQEINRWLYRSMVIGGWALMLSAPFIILGWIVMDRSGAESRLGWAWIPMLVSGIAITVMGRRARDRVDRSTYATRPELM